MEQYEINNGVREESDELQIDWMGILSKLLKKWKRIAIISFIFGVLGVISALLMTRQWGVTLTLAPEIQSRNSSSLGNLSTLLGLNPMQMTPSTDAMNITLFPEICKSTPFLAALLDVPLTSYVSEEDLEEGVKPLHTTVFRHFTGADKPKKGLSKWIAEQRQKKHPQKPYTGVHDPTELTWDQAMVVKALRDCIFCDVDKKNGVTTIRVVMNDKMMAKQLADTVCTRLQIYVSDYRTRKATADYEYYVTLANEAHEEMVKAQAAYAASVDYDRSVILQSANSEKDRLKQEATLANQIYSQMAQQRELARAKIQEDRPVYAVVQPATLPQVPMNSRKKRVLIWGFMGFFLSVAWFGFGEDYLKKMRVDMKEKMEENEA